MIWQMLGLAAALQGQPRLQAPPPIDCNSAAHHQLDFWLGDWDVAPAPQGRGPHGHSSITKAVNGCAIQEHFSATAGVGARAYEGVSYAAYDAFERRWQNYYVDTNGRSSWFLGGSDGKGMIFWSFEQAPVGPGMRRVELTPQSDGSVRQSGFITIDNGRSWVPIFDLIYRHAAP